MTNPRHGMVRFPGNANVFYVAICEQCQMAMPFGSEKHRYDWIIEHAKTGHTLKTAVDVRPDAIETEQRKNNLVAALRAKYARPAKLPAGTCGNYSECHRYIVVGDPMVSFAGKFYHAECVDDSVYLRLASITDLVPGIFDGVAPTAARTWTPSWAAAGLDLRKVESSDPMQRAHQLAGQFLADTLTAITPKKMNARERRRQKRRNKQWTK